MLSAISGINKYQAGFKASARYYSKPPTGKFGHSGGKGSPIEESELSQLMDTIQNSIEKGEIIRISKNIPNTEYDTMKKFKCDKDTILLAKNPKAPDIRILCPALIKIKHDNMGVTGILRNKPDFKDEQFDEIVEMLDKIPQSL